MVAIACLSFSAAILFSYELHNAAVSPFKLIVEMGNQASTCTNAGGYVLLLVLPTSHSSIGIVQDTAGCTGVCASVGDALNSVALESHRLLRKGGAVLLRRLRAKVLARLDASRALATSMALFANTPAFQIWQSQACNECAGAEIHNDTVSAHSELVGNDDQSVDRATGRSRSGANSAGAFDLTQLLHEQAMGVGLENFACISLMLLPGRDSTGQSHSHFQWLGGGNGSQFGGAANCSSDAASLMADREWTVVNDRLRIPWLGTTRVIADHSALDGFTAMRHAPLIANRSSLVGLITIGVAMPPFDMSLLQNLGGGNLSISLASPLFFVVDALTGQLLFSSDPKIPAMIGRCNGQSQCNNSVGQLNTSNDGSFFCVYFDFLCRQFGALRNVTAFSSIDTLGHDGGSGGRAPFSMLVDVVEEVDMHWLLCLAFPDIIGNLSQTELSVGNALDQQRRAVIALDSLCLVIGEAESSMITFLKATEHHAYINDLLLAVFFLDVVMFASFALAVLYACIYRPLRRIMVRMAHLSAVDSKQEFISIRSFSPVHEFYEMQCHLDDLMSFLEHHRHFFPTPAIFPPFLHVDAFAARLLSFNDAPQKERIELSMVDEPNFSALGECAGREAQTCSAVDCIVRFSFGVQTFKLDAFVMCIDFHLHPPFVLDTFQFSPEAVDLVVSAIASPLMRQPFAAMLVWFFGERVFAVYNYPQAAIEVAFELKCASTLASPGICSSLSGQPLPLAIGLSTGNVEYGPMGPVGFKRMNVVGSATHSAALLAELAERSGATLLVTEGVLNVSHELPRQPPYKYRRLYEIHCAGTAPQHCYSVVPLTLFDVFVHLLQVNTPQPPCQESSERDPESSAQNIPFSSFCISSSSALTLTLSGPSASSIFSRALAFQ